MKEDLRVDGVRYVEGTIPPKYERFVGDIYAQRFDDVTADVAFDGSFNIKVKVSDDRTIEITNRSTVYVRDGERLVKAGSAYMPCKCGGKRSLYKTELMLPSMWHEGCYHHYYGVFCPRCWDGDLIEFPDEGEELETFEKRCLKGVKSSQLEDDREEDSDGR